MGASKSKISKEKKIITDEAERLRKKDRGKRTWSQYMSQASAIYASKHKGYSPIGKPHKKRKPGKRKVHHKKKVGGITQKGKTHIDKNKFHNLDISIGAVNSAILFAKKGLEQSLSKKFLEKYKATTKTKKKKLQKDITNLKQRINKLSSKK